jgi:DICT domain-containing protein
MIGIIIGDLISAKRKSYKNKDGKEIMYNSIAITDDDGFRDEDQIFVFRGDESLTSLLETLNKNRGRKYQFTGKWTTYDGRKSFTATNATLNQ